MFLSESIQQKWQPVLDHPDLPEVKDAYKRAVTSMVLENQEKIWFTYTDGTDNYHSWRWGDFGEKKLWNHFPSEFAYSFNRGRDWDSGDLEVGIYRPGCILCVFNVDLLPFEDNSRGHTKQHDLVDPKLLAHWKV